MHIYIVRLFEGVDSVVLLPLSKHFESLSFLVGRQVGWLLDYLDHRLANWLARIVHLNLIGGLAGWLIGFLYELLAVCLTDL